MSKRKSWAEMSPKRRAVTAVLFVVQVSLAIAAWADLARRPADQVNGSKRKWALIIGINWVGPAAYALKGRRSA